jgi:hypothetical protein
MALVDKKIGPPAFVTDFGLVVNMRLLRQRMGTGFIPFIKKLTAIYQPAIGATKVIKLYDISTEYIYLPRPLAPLLLKNNIVSSVTVSFPPVSRIAADILIDLYENQQLIVDYLMTNIFNGTRIGDGTATAILNLRAGMGKTFVAAGIISALKMRTLYILPQTPLKLQAITDLNICFGPGIVGSYSTEKPYISPITVVIINTALKQTREFFSYFSLVIIDEVHTMCTTERRAIFRKASTHVLLAMSATTENRRDTMDEIARKELTFTCDGGIVRAENIPGFTYGEVTFKSLVTVCRYHGHPDYTKALIHPSTKRVFTPYMNQQFVADERRMQIAIKYIRDLYNQSHCIFVFSEERLPLEILRQKLSNDGCYVEAPELDTVSALGEIPIDGGGVKTQDNLVINMPKQVKSDVGKFIGGTTDEEIDYLKIRGKILLSTYSYAGAGVSILKMTAIVFYTPRRSNMIQILGRILRRGSDMSIVRRVIDITDVCTPMRGQLKDRLIGYEHYNMKVEYTDVYYNDDPTASNTDNNDNSDSDYDSDYDKNNNNDNNNDKNNDNGDDSDE